MTKISLEKFFVNTEIKYYEPEILITILEDILGKDIEMVKMELDELKIVFNAEQIVDYLNNKFEKEEPEVKARIENLKPSKQLSELIDLNRITYEEIEKSSQHFWDQLTAARYEFDSYTLNYFNKYSEIVRNKARKILDIIEEIVNKDYSNVADLMVELDIQLDENGNITREDIIRLILPFIHNYNSLVEKVNIANNLETYLTFKLSKHSVYRNGWDEGELYPTESIQIKSLYYDCLPGNISLSTNQKKLLRKKQTKSMKKLASILLD